MSTGLLNIVKLACNDMMDNAQLCDLRYGKVVSTSPLKVQITNQLTIPSSLLVVPKQLTNRSVNITIDGESKTITINNALKTGDKVALLRKHGGQSYFILDRI